MPKAFIAKNIYDPLHAYIYRRDGRLSLYKYFKSREKKPLEENLLLQKRQLYELLRYSLDSIPYYQEHCKGVHLTQETVLEDIKRFPILTKDIIRENLEVLHKPIDGMKWTYNSSGGSTGIPVRFIQDYMMEAGHEATTRQQYDWTGYKYSKPMIRLWGSEKDIFKIKEKLSHRFASWIKSETLLNSFMMGDEEMRSYVDVINRIKPRLIVAYAEAIYELAKFIDDKKLAVESPGAIISSASVLYPEYRKLIEKIFRTPVFNRYGSREVGNVASECEKHEGLHINIFTHYVEILDKKLKTCKEGEKGDIYVTLLTNFTMPLIRFKIGDMAVATSKKCACGRGLPLLKEVIGRDNDMFITSQGKFVHSGVVNYLFFHKDYIKRFQVLQKCPDHLVVKLVPSHEFTRLHLREIEGIKSSLRKIFGQNCRIDLKVVKEIKPTASGKFRFNIREF